MGNYREGDLVAPLKRASQKVLPTKIREEWIGNSQEGAGEKKLEKDFLVMRDRIPFDNERLFVSVEILEVLIRAEKDFISAGVISRLSTIIRGGFIRAGAAVIAWGYRAAVVAVGVDLA